VSQFFSKQITPVERAPLSRILAVLPIEAEWTDSRTRKKVKAVGQTQNVGPSTALVNMQPLPLVGDEIKLTVTFEGKTLIETRAEVIRIQRDLVMPLAALSIVDKEENWDTAVWSAANEIAASQMVVDEDDIVH
jgi:hypothetical protein